VTDLVYRHFNGIGFFWRALSCPSSAEREMMNENSQAGNAAFAPGVISQRRQDA
jgi:hypothetical protein